MSSTLYIDPAVKPLFPKGDNLDFWLDDEIGVMFNKGSKGRQLRWVEAGGQKFLLKRLDKESLLRQMRLLLFGLRPVCGSLREVWMLQELQTAGFKTMEPVAWGQRRIRGFTVRGFLFVRKVEGKEVSGLFSGLDGPGRSRLAEEIGELTGRLHTAGFFQPVRLKDLIQTDSGLVLIDRETSKPCPVSFMRWKCRVALVRCARRIVRDGHQLKPSVIRSFLRGYRRGIASRWVVSSAALARRVFPAVRENRALADLMKRKGLSW
jgi:tRNA A-37 threonylcarbamoyl transferase component Bud32